VQKAPIIGSITYGNHFTIEYQLDATAGGLLAMIGFYNKSLPSLPRTPSVEVWYPIAGHLEYMDQGPQPRRILVGSIHEVGSGNNSQIFDLRIDPGKKKSLTLYTKVDLAQAERMRELAENFGMVTLLLHLYFSILYNAGMLGGQRTFGLHPVFQFDVSKAQMQEWIVGWTSSHARSADLPSSVPKNVLDDYIEAVSTFNINAYKASVAMARRALQQALEDKGATKGSKLLDQINELEGKGLLSKPTSYLAHAVRAFGNYGAHPNDDLLAQITRDDAETTLMAAKKILKELYK